MGYIIAGLGVTATVVYLLWLYKRHPFLFKAFGIFSMFVFGISFLAKLHDLKECITYSVATILFTIATEEALDLKNQLHQKLIEEDEKTDVTKNTSARKILRLVNPAGIILLALVAFGFFLNLKLLPLEPPYMP